MKQTGYLIPALLLIGAIGVFLLPEYLGQGSDSEINVSLPAKQNADTRVDRPSLTGKSTTNLTQSWKLGKPVSGKMVDEIEFKQPDTVIFTTPEGKNYSGEYHSGINYLIARASVEGDDSMELKGSYYAYEDILVIRNDDYHYRLRTPEKAKEYKKRVDSRMKNHDSRGQKEVSRRLANLKTVFVDFQGTSTCKPYFRSMLAEEDFRTTTDVNSAQAVLEIILHKTRPHSDATDLTLSYQASVFAVDDSDFHLFRHRGSSDDDDIIDACEETGEELAEAMADAVDDARG